MARSSWLPSPAADAPRLTDVVDPRSALWFGRAGASDPVSGSAQPAVTRASKPNALGKAQAGNEGVRPGAPQMRELRRVTA